MPSPMNTGLLLAPDEPAPVSIENRAARSHYVIVCDHASNRLPRALGDLGLSEDDRKAHIAWDIGAAGVARLLAKALDAVLFVQEYSRLVIDCNRPLTAPDSIPESELSQMTDRRRVEGSVLHASAREADALLQLPRR